jgi:hypothetical protein
VGLPGWVLPDVAVLDEHGLNDWVVARSRKGGATTFPVSAAQLGAAFAQVEVDGDGRYPRAGMVEALTPLGDSALARGLVDFLLLQLAPAGASSLSPAELSRLDDLLAGLRFMAHERLPPPGYVEDFAPNVEVVDQQAVIKRRETPLDEARVRALEKKWRRRTR